MFDGGVYKYNGGGKAGGSGGGVMFDDYGRPISVFGGKEQNGAGRSNSDRIVKAVPKVEDSGDARSGVQKFRVKILSEGYGQADMDVLCQVCGGFLLVIELLVECISCCSFVWLFSSSLRGENKQVPLIYCFA